MRTTRLMGEWEMDRGDLKHSRFEVEGGQGIRGLGFH